jgi:drug/metabolite transporter (DMT)-like permease
MSTVGPPPKDGNLFRGIVGLLCVVGSLIGFGGLYFIAIPPGNRDALMLALGIVFGWGSAVVQSEYGASTTGRKAAESAIKQMEGKSS